MAGLACDPKFEHVLLVYVKLVWRFNSGNNILSLDSMVCSQPCMLYVGNLHDGLRGSGTVLDQLLRSVCVSPWDRFSACPVLCVTPSRTRHKADMCSDRMVALRRHVSLVRLSVIVFQSTTRAHRCVYLPDCYDESASK